MGPSIALLISTTTFFVLLLCIVSVVIGGGRDIKSDASSSRNLQGRQCIDADAVSQASTRALHDDLTALTRGSTFFSIFRVALDKSCPFWADNGQCSIRECSVCNCAPHEVPTAWRREKDGCRARQPSPGNVDRSLPKFLSEAKKRKHKMHSGNNNIWYVEDAESEADYVDLRKNPEAYTAYSGAHANSIWSAIYEENCFELAPKCESGICEPGTCKEERVFYRLISGVHTSITAHLAKQYRFADGRWGENRQIYRERIAKYPERVKNLNLALAVTTRAIAKISSDLRPHNYAYVTGDAVNDAYTAEQVNRVLASSLLDPDCRKPPFDESDMFLAGGEKYRLDQFRAKFHNISRIMDCVGCEKCRLWGKLQFLAIGTALRILFENNSNSNNAPKLSRNQVIALYNLLHKLTSSALWVEKMHAEEQQRLQRASLLRIAGAALAALTLCLVSLSRSACPALAKNSSNNNTSKKKGIEKKNNKKNAKLVGADTGVAQSKIIIHKDAQGDAIKEQGSSKKEQ